MDFSTGTYDELVLVIFTERHCSLGNDYSNYIIMHNYKIIKILYFPFRNRSQEKHPGQLCCLKKETKIDHEENLVLAFVI